MALMTDNLRTALEKAEALQQHLANLGPGSPEGAEMVNAISQLGSALAEVRRAAAEAGPPPWTPVAPDSSQFVTPTPWPLANRQLEQAELEAILQGLADGVAVLDAENRLVYVNDALARAAGYASAGHMRQNYTAGALWDHFELRDARGQSFPLDQLPHRQIFRGEAATPVTLGYRAKDSGEERWVVVRAEIIPDEADRLRFAVITIHDITDRHQARTALRESQERYHSLFEYSPISLWEEDFSEVQAYLADLRGQGVDDLEAYWVAHPEAAAEAMRRIRVLDVNAVTVPLYGAQNKTELLRQVGRIFGPETYPIIVQELAALARGEHEFEAEGVNYRLTGERLDVSVRWAMPPGQASPATRVLVSIRDITRRKRAEQALQDSEARFRAYVEHSPQGIFVIDSQGGYEDANPAACQLVGYPRAELLQLSPGNLAPAEEVEAALGRVSTVLTAGAVSEEVQLQRKDGVVISVILNAVRLPDGAAMAFCTDITERKHMEAALRQSEGRYRELFNSMTEGFALHEVVYAQDGRPCDYRFLDLNPAFGGLTGLKREKLIGACQSQVLPDEDPYWLEIYSQVALTGQAVHVEHYSPPLQRHFDVFAYRPAPGQFATLFMDITARKQAEEALRALNAELEQRVAARTTELASLTLELSEANAALVRAGRMKDEFLATMSHELRTPLTAVQGLSEALQMGTYGPLTAKQIKTLGTIHESGQHLLELITDILDLARLEAGKLELQTEVVIVKEVCQISLHTIQPRAQKKNLRVSLAFDAHDHTLRMDAHRLKQMLVHLLDNAVKFTPAGGEIGLRVEGDAARQQIRFAVWDTGIGIAPEDLPRLFQLFTQLDGRLARQYEGIGLGLALVQRMAALHGGEVTVASEGVPGRGSTFTLVLPWTCAQGEARPEPVQPATDLDQRSQPLVLITDDDEAALTALLRAQAYRVEVTRQGAEALQQIHQLRPAMILIDILMPGLGGLETIRQLRADPDAQLAATPVIALTALNTAGAGEHCLAAGATAYLAKPVLLKRLLQLIQTLLGREAGQADGQAAT